jgi:hypothetical protein
MSGGRAFFANFKFSLQIIKGICFRKKMYEDLSCLSFFFMFC